MTVPYHMAVAALVILTGMAPGLSAATTKRTTTKSSRVTRASTSKVQQRTVTPRRTRGRAAPPLSFLRENSFSLEEVIQQVRTNRKLQLRYANHFHIAPEQVIPYFRQNFVESYVPKTQRYKVWMKRPDGSTYYVYQTFRAGERVLALRNGQPVLKWACGNPLLTKLPVVKKRVVQRTKKVLPNVQERRRYYNVETPFETPVERRLAALPPIYEAPGSEMTQLVSRPAFRSVGRAFPAIALIPLAFRNNHPPEIPEPSTAMLALVGLGGLGAFSRGRRR